MKFLKSRKILIAVAGLVVAFAGEFGLELDNTFVIGVLSMTATLILGIAHEDNGAKSASTIVIDPAMLNAAPKPTETTDASKPKIL